MACMMHGDLLFFEISALICVSYFPTYISSVRLVFSPAVVETILRLDASYIYLQWLLSTNGPQRGPSLLMGDVLIKIVSLAFAHVDGVCNQDTTECPIISTR